jgi:predicted nucleic acid-binding protein
MNQSVVQMAAQLAASCGMRGADSVYTAVAHQLNIPLATLDADQRTKAGQMVSIQKDFC